MISFFRYIEKKTKSKFSSIILPSKIKPKIVDACSILNNEVNRKQSVNESNVSNN